MSSAFPVRVAALRMALQRQSLRIESGILLRLEMALIMVDNLPLLNRDTAMVTFLEIMSKVPLRTEREASRLLTRPLEEERLRNMMVPTLARLHRNLVMVTLMPHGTQGLDLSTAM